MPPHEIARIQTERQRFPKGVVTSLVVLLVMGFAANRLMRRGGQLVHRGSLVLGDIENLTPEEYLGEMAKQAVATKLTESPFLIVLRPPIITGPYADSAAVQLAILPRCDGIKGKSILNFLYVKDLNILGALISEQKISFLIFLMIKKMLGFKHWAKRRQTIRAMALEFGLTSTACAS